VNGNQRIAVEVKRPESDRRLEAAVVSAKEKFADHPDCWGAIVLELTDCLLPTNEKDIEARIMALRDAAHMVIWDEQTRAYKPGFGRVVYLGVVFRAAWAIGGETNSRLRLLGIGLHSGYSSHSNSVQGLTATWFQKAFNRAYDEVVLRIGT
jgi:hypothetical protein